MLDGLNRKPDGMPRLRPARHPRIEELGPLAIQLPPGPQPLRRPDVPPQRPVQLLAWLASQPPPRGAGELVGAALAGPQGARWVVADGLRGLAVVAVAAAAAGPGVIRAGGVAG